MEKLVRILMIFLFLYVLREKMSERFSLSLFREEKVVRVRGRARERNMAGLEEFCWKTITGVGLQVEIGLEKGIGSSVGSSSTFDNKAMLQSGKRGRVHRFVVVKLRQFG